MNIFLSIFSFKYRTNDTNSTLNTFPSISGRAYHGRGIPYKTEHLNRLKEIKHMLLLAESKNANDKNSSSTHKLYFTN